MSSGPLQGRRLLVAEDEFYIAMELEQDLANAGAAVLGPVPSIDKALALIATERDIDLAVLDINLGGEMAYPVADALVTRGIPFVFTTGYVDGELDGRYPGVTRCAKPIELPKLMAALSSALAG